MLNKRRIIYILIAMLVILNLLFIGVPKTYATSNNITNIILSDNNITVDDESISEDASKDIYLSRTMDNGGSSSEATDANIEITNIVNINNSGIYEFTGDLSDGQISINSNNINGDITIILNDVNITCKNAPAIFVYNTKTDSTTCNVIIKTASGSINTISGGKIKQSVADWVDQSEILYYIDKGYDDDRTYYERYKYDGAISSDISLTFEGDGILTVNALAKEGIETKRDITINSGNYIINSLDDGINACTDNESIITINGGTVLVNVDNEAEEGDGIDSNGYIYINGGAVYAFASETSGDNGLDSDCGTYINGGIAVGTGNMADAVSEDSKQEFIQLQFNTKIAKDTLITITDKNKTPMVAFKADRSYSILTISTPDLIGDEYYVYEGGNIEGDYENGLYTNITSFEGGNQKEYSTTSDMGKPGDFNGNIKNENINEQNDNEQSYKVYYYTIVILAVILVILIIVAIILKQKRGFNMKGKVLTLFIGIVIGAIIATVGFLIYNKTTEEDVVEPNNMVQMDENRQMQAPSNENMGEPPQMPNGNNVKKEIN